MVRTIYVYKYSSTKSSALFVESLRTYFEQFGKVDACTIMRDAAGRSRCFAFLTFDEPASVNAVMVREHFLDGKIVRSFSNPTINLLLMKMSNCRLILNALYLAKSTSVRPNSSLVVWRAQSPLTLCESSSRNSGKWSIRLLCWIGRLGGVKALGLLALRIRMFSLSLGLGILRLMGRW